MDCLFCSIAAGEIPAKTVYEDDLVMAFHDIAPAAPVHILLIPKPHIPSAAALTERDGDLVGHIFAVIARLAKEYELEEGFRVVSNVGALAGQSVPHLHFHLLSGRALAWPPG
ncbi:MAG: histidine triad nucleotide-binding protein [Oscillospiraceae bacterium]|jgi:histidine triad (HIT) family protein|nr:histidine triad nucleotide-binding protein [Oscillospiraceae bacterium]